VQAVAAQVLVSAERLQRMCLLKSKFLFDFHVVSYNFLSVLVTDGRYHYSIAYAARTLLRAYPTLLL
jgi:hypothetical protein